MKKRIVIFLMVLLLVSCEKVEPQKTNNFEQKKTIYTSFYPIYFLTKSLVGEDVEVINLVPAGGEPHEYEPTLKQIGDFNQADLIILSGLGLESYEEKLLDKYGTEKIILVSENLKNLIEIGENKENHVEENNNGHEHGNIDPHTWISVKTYIEMANTLAGELEKKGYKINKEVIEKLKDLDKNYVDILKNCSQKEIVTSHEAFGYLARDYGFQQHAILGISPEEEPSIHTIVGVIEMIKTKKLRYIFSEAFVSEKFANTIKKETGVQVLTLHPLETLSREEEKAKEDYISVMMSNLEKLKIGLECK